MWAIVPFKGAPSGKSRLAKHFNEDQRTILANAMLRDVLDALASSTLLSGIVLTTRSTDTEWIQRYSKIRVYRENAQNLPDAVTEASEYARVQLKAEGTFIIPGDLPLIQTGEIALALSVHESVTIIPDMDEIGTNGIISTPPNALEYVFDGKSYRPHIESAKRAGLDPQTIHIPGFGRDVDTIEDVRAVVEIAPNTHTARTIKNNQLLQNVQVTAA